MDYYQGIVLEYLRADRRVFVNSECCIQLVDGANPDVGTHWYCDIVAVALHEQTAYLCEVSYSKGLSTLFKRLAAWNQHWEQLRHALARDSAIPKEWTVRPWLFVPEDLVATAEKRVSQLGLTAGQGVSGMPIPKITTLEAVAPWRYRSWDRKGEDPKYKKDIPEWMR